MVRKLAENGTYYHEPPYTEDEELALYAAAAPVNLKMLTVGHRRPLAAPQKPPQKSPRQSPEE